MAILIIGEKPSVSRAISSVVGADTARKGCNEGNGCHNGKHRQGKALNGRKNRKVYAFCFLWRGRTS